MAPEPAADHQALVSALSGHVLALANEAHAVLGKLGRQDLAGLLDEEANRWRGASTIVMVAGEVNRGKTSLLNSLLGRGDLLPVAADDASRVPVYITHAPTEQLIVERWDDAGRLQVHTAEMADLGALATGANDAVRRLKLALPAQLLSDGMTIIDSPGIGAMTSGRRELALAIARYADTLLFVTSAEEPLLRSEADFLAVAAQRVADVQLVLTKADLLADPDAFMVSVRDRLGQFARIAEREGQPTFSSVRLREIAARPAAVTSSLFADRANAALDSRRRADLLARSGIETLRDGLRGRLAARSQLRLASLAQTLATAAAAAIATEAAIDAAQASNVMARRAEAERLKTLARGPWRNRLVNELSRIGVDAQRELNEMLSGLEVRYAKQAEGSDNPAALLGTMQADVNAAIEASWLELSAGLEERLQNCVTDLSKGLGELAGLPDGITPKSALERAFGGETPASSSSRVPDLIDHGIPALSVTFLVSRLLALFAFAGPQALVVSAVAGIATSAARVLRQAKARTRQQVQGVVTAAFREARAELGAELQVTLLSRRQAAEEAVDEALAAVTREPPGALPERRAGLATLERIAREAERIRSQLVSAGEAHVRSPGT